MNETSERFGERVRARFPPGSSEKDLVNELRREHFKIAPLTWPAKVNPEGLTFMATYNGSYWVACEMDWTVSWRAENGRITIIGGGYADNCL